ncbi:MAG: RHS repeat-associated protein, partial [Bacteroidia bacterium]
MYPTYIANFLAGRAGSADCPIYQSIYAMLIGFDHPGSWDVLKSVNGFKTTMWSQYTWQTWLSFFETGLGNKNTWDQLFIEMPNTQSSWLSVVKTNEAQAFLFYALLELQDEVLLRSTVSSMTGKTIEDWLDAIEAQYGVEYTNSLKGAVGINDDDPYWRYKLAENHVYGSSRLGLVERNLVLVQQISETSDTLYYSHLSDSIKTFYRGEKRYELSNHLGNVLAVITDRRIQACGAGDVMYYNAQVVSVSDYYPFGMGIKEREWKDSTFSYRFGFQGQEGDDEVNGKGNTYDYGFRIYNPRLGKFLSVDPLFKTYPWYTPYQFAGNMPIAAIDLDGLEQAVVTYGRINSGSFRLVTYMHINPRNRVNDIVHGTGGFGYSKPGREQVRVGQLRPFSSENIVMTKKFKNYYEPDPNGISVDVEGATYTLTRGTYAEAMGKKLSLPSVQADGSISWNVLGGFIVKEFKPVNVYFNNDAFNLTLSSLNKDLSQLDDIKSSLDEIGQKLEAN